MIPFFRKKRKQMADEDRPVQYIRYAIGEIVLVVIGIIIALQLDALKKKQDYKQIEITVLQSLREELEKDTIDLQRLIDVKDLQLTNSRYMLGFFINPDQAIEDTAAFFSKMNQPYHFYVDNPNKTAFETAKASGNLFRIRNDNLVSSLSFYFSDNNLSQFLTESKNFSLNHMDVRLRKYRTEAQFGGPNKELYVGYKGEPFPFNVYFKDLEMENFYNGNSVFMDIGIGLTRTKKESATKLIQMIDDELEGLN